MDDFHSRIFEEIHAPLTAERIETIQINLGAYCNQTCRHCHVDAGPLRFNDLMSVEIIESVLNLISNNEIKRVDITGGAPELHPRLEYLVTKAACLGKKLIVRSNLTLLGGEKRNLVELFKTHRVEVMASLPCYLEKNVDRMRGAGTYRSSIQALKLLNAAGYGVEGSEWALNLIYNPNGPFLPNSQKNLEADYRRELKERHGVVFSKLFVLANMPVGRFKKELVEDNKLADYACLLKRNFNKETISNLMCRKMLSVRWDGQIFDCDFNQTLNLPVNHEATLMSSGDLDLDGLNNRRIRVGEHCFACTAGKGSSCGGELLN